MKDNQPLFLVVYFDRHIDDQYELYSDFENAKAACRRWMENPEYAHYGEYYVEETPDPSWFPEVKPEFWYWLTFNEGSDFPSARIETVYLDQTLPY